MAQQEADEPKVDTVVQNRLQPLGVLLRAPGDQGQDRPFLMVGAVVVAGAAQDLGLQLVECGVQIGHDPQRGGPLGAGVLLSQQELQVLGWDYHHGPGL